MVFMGFFCSVSSKGFEGSKDFEGSESSEVSKGSGGSESSECSKGSEGSENSEGSESSKGSKGSEVSKNSVGSVDYVNYSLDCFQIDKVQKMFYTALEFHLPDCQLIRNRLNRR